MTISVQHLCEDHDGDTVLSEHHENLDNTVGERHRVSVQKVIDGFNSASSDSLFPDLGKVWRSVIVLDNFPTKQGPPPFPHSRLRRVVGTTNIMYGIPCWMFCVILRLVLLWEHSSTK